jgi:hypothetical protein
VNAAGTSTPSRQLLELARRLGRLPPPSHKDPERYHIEKSSIVGELRSIAYGLDWRIRQQPGPSWGQSLNGDCPVQPAPQPTLPPAPDKATPNGVIPLHCRHCRKRQAQQRHRHRLKLPGLDLLQWADQQEERSNAD